MITVYVIRHGQAKPDYADDFSRQLTDRGRGTLERLGEKIAQDHPKLELLLASPAMRTMQSANCLGLCDEVTSVPELYLASARVIKEVLAEVGSGCSTIAIVGHNPGLSDLLTAMGFVANLDTGQCVRLRAQSLEQFLAGELISADYVDS